MSIVKNYRVLIYKHNELLSSYEVHTEMEDGEYVDVSSFHCSGEPFGDAIEDDAIELILESGLESGVGIAQGHKIEWDLLDITNE